MAKFFIDNPVLAWVIAIFITLAGVLSLPSLPVSQYPDVAPPQVTISTRFAGAAPEDLYQQVTQPIEEELNGISGMLYFESTSDATGSVTITVTFASGTNVSQAVVDTQNRLRRVESSLPAQVQQEGLTVEEAGSSYLMFVSLFASEESGFGSIALADYATRNVLNEIRRVPGVGKAQLFSAERAMRIWIDPAKLVGLDLSVTDITAAISEQNAQVSAGSIGAQPAPAGQQTQATLLVTGQLTTPEAFETIVLRAREDGSLVRLSDVAEVELDAEYYSFKSYLNGEDAAQIGIQLSPTGNALDTAEGVRTKLEELGSSFPEGVEYSIPYDTTPFVSASIEKVVHTLLEAVALVFLVMMIFLQNLRYTVIPMLVVPIALAGTLAVMLGAGFSINVLTMFAMVLAIGILVDDAIVVVENVERIMSEEGLSPREASKKAMSQISGAIVGITLALMAVFVPLAFFPGSVGIIYQQFSLTMVVSIFFSAYLALSLTPALCATFLKPIPPGHSHEKRGPAGWFNRGFDRTSKGYSGLVGWLIRRSGRMMLVYLALVIGLGWFYARVPAGFLPQEDQGYLIVSMQGPPEATSFRMREVTKAVEGIALSTEGVSDIVTVQGFSFSGQGPNSAISFVTLDDWSERKAPGLAAGALAGQLSGQLFGIRDAIAFAISPPPIAGLGTGNGFAFRLQDRGNNGNAALQEAAGQIMAGGRESPVLGQMYIEGLTPGPQINLEIDREKANAFGVTFGEINRTISVALGSGYVNDFPNAGKMQSVIVQAKPEARASLEEVMKLNVRNMQGGMVPLSSFATADWGYGPVQIVGYNGYPSIRINGEAASGFSSGEALSEMQRLAAELPSGFTYEWTGQSLQEIESGSQAPILIGLSVLFVFLCLAGLYGSWSIPLSVMLIVPMGAVGTVAAVTTLGLANDVFFTVGLITIVGLSAKNAILIVEVTKDLITEGQGLLEATVEACRLRFRPILMTSLAFTMGVVPMAIATGPSAASQNAIGAYVVGGMISATLLGVIFAPVFFVFVMKLTGTHKKLAGKTELHI
ncbi:multidrug efflux RND transporter permease subunit [Roseovarius indicus]|uniref:Efflux pump membrane transporter n=1 Tax=Roseovarius indicus TaxID=540747 RepID=A0A0T5PC56_9RHOB|nr:multidrug efflux RND transporter permease subunit [Roseovarius indicus]KRS18691.1 acriflavine resistance protein B [Roseovarius indicus]QEW25742.1 Toluene efflux pump membrane transporter TtgB [Roseovarius indicus]SFD99348.1 multidrug efflux pump [Roseovarius indicus]